jgi:lycopene cyclase domain-containing protein
LNEKYLYLALNLLSISVPFAFSFYKPAPFYKTWKQLSVAILLPALIFIVWDEYFTRLGVWGFNPRYLTGIYIGNLPLEEVLFFICIPYASVFTYHALNYLIKTDYLAPFQKHISLTLIVLLIGVGCIHYDKLYTSVTFFGLALFIMLLLVLVKPVYMGRFYFAFVIILIPFFLVNGILTGSFISEEVVWYNPAEQMNIRMGTIPIEDTFYGMLLILMNVSLFEFLQKRKHSNML